ncbi:helix-turn-helix transcriptional regulator [Microbacterium sp. Marseille-Q6965]|uniref:helix-turn-helix transcriptional regulator n=1 Tax=Microbacterium sp. Marseille-Q6965 TaxID=2965072 RepID=UPI0021B8423E|nr:helix-turn-helix transcriptional regulator [Microbacterium sp. Marseille-Q6965]
MERSELADFLRRRREQLQPGDVGLPPGARRRAPGLRREEVAHLTGMSVDYYTRLEQARGPQPSPQLLQALARTLRLTADERDYVYRLAGHAAPDRLDGAGHVAPGLMRVLDRLEDTPALILTGLGETLVANRPAVALFGDHTARTGWDRSDIHRWFVDPSSRALYPEADRDRQSRALVANLRAAYGLGGPRSRAAELVRVLRAASAEFVRLWERHEVARRFEDHKTLVHPELGAIEVDCQALFTEDQSQTLLVLTAPPRTEAWEKLRLLAVLGAQRFAPAPGAAAAAP